MSKVCLPRQVWPGHVREEAQLRRDRPLLHAVPLRHEALLPPVRNQLPRP